VVTICGPLDVRKASQRGRNAIDEGGALEVEYGEETGEVRRTRRDRVRPTRSYGRQYLFVTILLLFGIVDSNAYIVLMYLLLSASNFKEFYMDLLSTVNFALTVGGIVGGVIAYRSGVERSANQVQESVIAALDAELNSLHHKIDDMKAENTRLCLIIDTICAALRSRGLAVSIDGDIVSISDRRGQSTMTRIQEEQVL
jgi:hypothetical protein